MDSLAVGLLELSGLSDYQNGRNVNLLEMSDRLIEWKLLDRLIRIVGMVVFSDSRTIRFLELLDNWIVGQSDSWIVRQLDYWKIVGLSKLLDC